MVPIAYNVRNLVVRWKTTLLTAFGFTLVVAAMIIMLAFVKGMQTVCVISGEVPNVLVLEEGVSDEVYSRLEADVVAQIENSSHVLRDEKGRPLSSRELFMVVSQPTDTPGVYRLWQARGILPAAWRVHQIARLTSGRHPRPGQSELIVGAALERENGLQLGSRFRLGRKDWQVVGVMEAGGSALESEIWCDLNELADHFRRVPAVTSLVLRTSGATRAQQLVDDLSTSNSLTVAAISERAYYQRQGQQTRVMLAGGLAIALFMGLGAVFSIMNTMFAAIAVRNKDIAILRILGYSRQQIMLSFLVEGLLIAAIGGILGACIGYMAHGIGGSSALGPRSLAFAFQVDSQVLLGAAVFTLAMGLSGGLLPAARAMRINVLSALR